MNQTEVSSLRISQKLEILSTLFKNQSVRPILDAFSDEELVAAHEFLWNKLVEIHYLIKKTEFVREEVTKHMMGSAAYQNQQGCDLRLDYCKGVECIWSNPACAGNKVKNNMEVMARVIVKYLESANTRIEVFEYSIKSPELSSLILQ